MERFQFEPLFANKFCPNKLSKVWVTQMFTNFLERFCPGGERITSDKDSLNQNGNCGEMRSLFKIFVQIPSKFFNQILSSPTFYNNEYHQLDKKIKCLHPRNPELQMISILVAFEVHKCFWRFFRKNL